MKNKYTGWWYTYPSEKYESQWEGLSYLLWEKNMFQTTKQYSCHLWMFIPQYQTNEIL